MTSKRKLFAILLIGFLLIFALPVIAQDDGDCEGDDCEYYDDEYYEDCEGDDCEYYDDEYYDCEGDDCGYYDEPSYCDDDYCYYDDGTYCDDEACYYDDEYYDEYFDGEYYECETEEECDAYYDAYYECETEEECAFLDDEYYDDYGEVFEDDNAFGEGSAAPAEGQLAVVDGQLDGEPSEQQQQLWDKFTSIIPANWVGRISAFELTNDPDTSGYVYGDGSGKFVLALNPVELNNPQELTHTIIHEFAHVLSLNDSQFHQSGSTCSTLQLDEGCTTQAAYINKFNSQFANSTQFVSDYASTNVAEDFAESFTAFVLGQQVSADKVSFFNQFPELVALKNSIRANMATASG